MARASKATPAALKIVEIPRETSALSAEDEASIRTLKGHPGFEALLRKLRLQGAFLESALRKQRFDKIEEVYLLQGGIHWINWIAQQLKESTGGVAKEKETPREPFGFEQAEFDRVAKALKVIGGHGQN